MNRRRSASLVSAGLILGASLFAGAVPAAAKGHLDVLLDGLTSPKGIAAGPKSVAVSQGAFGPPGPVLEYLLTGSARGTARDDHRPAQPDRYRGHARWCRLGIAADGTLSRQALDGTIDADPRHRRVPGRRPGSRTTTGEGPAESNPYGLAALPSNDVLVADAAGNDIIRVSPNGDAVTVARFTLEEIAPDQFAEAVPTSIAIGRDGWAYVGQLTGVPAIAGLRHIWRVNPNAEGAVCSVDTPIADCSVWKSGFTSIIDVAINPKNGTLYVYEIAEDGFLAFEEGCFGAHGLPTGGPARSQGRQDTRARARPAVAAGRRGGEPERHDLRDRRHVRRRPTPSPAGERLTRRQPSRQPEVGRAARA